MTPTEIEDKLRRILKEKGSISISNCAREFGVDVATILDIVSNLKTQKEVYTANMNDVANISTPSPFSLPLEEEKDLPLEELVQKGESDTLEFKASMLKPTRPEPNIALIEKEIRSSVDEEKKKEWQQRLVDAQKTQKGLADTLRQEICKTLAAFLNSEGGVLLVGVEDDGTISGVEKDFPVIPGIRKDWDGWLQELDHLVTAHIGTEFINYIKVSRIPFQGKTVAKIIVKSSPRPAYVEKTDVEFYIRSLNTTHALNTKQASNYIFDHWKR